MKDPIVLRRADILSPVDASYWKDLFYRVIKIGTELEVAPPKGKARADFETGIRTALMPSGSLEDLGVNGVLDVSPEHCGIEIRIIGRHPHFRSLQKQYASIMNVLKEHGSRTRPTCGLHFHMLTPTLAEPVPEIILANLWNLVRRYAPELRFITSGGDTRSALCRRRNHNSHLEMVRHSPSILHMSEIQKILKDSRIVPEHQNFLNLEHIGFTENGSVNPFHLEFRFPDADISPTSVSAKTFLFLALALKSVDLSQYGVIHVGKVVPWRRKVALLDMLSNNDGNLATSDTTSITDEIIEEIRQGCYELLDLLAPAFEWFNLGTFAGINPSLDVLLALSERPISLMRCSGYDWDEIETLLAMRTDIDDSGLDEMDRRLMQRIELGEWAGQPSIDAWQWHAARELFLPPQELERRLSKIVSLRGLRWDARQGTMVFNN
jgi:hypothetical protein